MEQLRVKFLLYDDHGCDLDDKTAQIEAHVVEMPGVVEDDIFCVSFLESVPTP